MDLDLSSTLEKTLELSRNAARLLQSGYRKTIRINKKGVVDLVTEYDLRSEELIRESLAREFPFHSVIAEEGKGISTSDFTWYVDPLDGTTNFAHGHPFFCVSIALCFKNEPIVGV